MKKILNYLKNIFLFIFIYNTKKYTIKAIIYTDLHYTEYKVYCIYRILGIKLNLYIIKFNYMINAQNFIYNKDSIIYNIKYEYK